MKNKFKIEIIYNDGEDVKLKIGGEYNPDTLLATLTSALGNVVKQLIEPESYNGVLSLINKQLNDKLTS